MKRTSKRTNTLEPLGVNEIPTSKTRISFTFMNEYANEKMTDEEKKWYAEILRKNYVNDKFDIAPIRKAFIDKYFPHLNEKKVNTVKMSLIELMNSY